MRQIILTFIDSGDWSLNSILINYLLTISHIVRYCLCSIFACFYLVLYRSDDETAGIEERKHTEKLAAKNAEYAKLNSEYADTLRLLSQAEAIASRANIAVARAVEQAIRIEEEIKMKAQRDAERREEERLRLEEEKRLESEEQDRVEDLRRSKETDRRRRESLLPTSDRIPMFDKWPTHE